MWHLTLAQMRRSLGRLTAAGLAIVIGTAFVAATLVAGGVITRTSYDAIAASFADADLVVTAPDNGNTGLTATDLAALRGASGVDAVDGRRSMWVELVAGAKRTVPEITAVASDPRFEAQVLTSGAFPADVGQVALPGASRSASARGSATPSPRTERSSRRPPRPGRSPRSNSPSSGSSTTRPARSRSPAAPR